MRILLKKVPLILAGLLLLVVLIGGIVKAQEAYAGIISLDTPSVTMGQYRNYEFFASSTAPTTIATTTTATSTNIAAYIDSFGRVDNGYFVIAGAKKVSMYFGRGDTSGQGNLGSTLFRVQVTPDGTNWYDFNKLIQNVATSTSALTVLSVATTTAATATSTTIYALDLSNDSFYGIRCIVLETTDGEHRCAASANW